MGGNCNGRCIGGGIIAIIFGALFLWTLVLAIRLHWAAFNPFDYSIYWYYLLSMVFIAIAKVSKMWAASCTCTITRTKKRRRR